MTVGLMPMTGHPLPDKAPVAVDSVHYRVVSMAPWAPAKPLLDLYAEPCDLVLVAVPPEMGAALGEWIATQLKVLDMPDDPSVLLADEVIRLDAADADRLEAPSNEAVEAALAIRASAKRGKR